MLPVDIYGTHARADCSWWCFAVRAGTELNPLGNSFIGIYSSDPLQQGQSGFFNGYIVGKTDVARRIAGLVPSRFVNRASCSTSSWTVSNPGGTQTFTQNLSDPFGGTGAASVSNSTPSAQRT